MAVTQNIIYISPSFRRAISWYDIVLRFYDFVLLDLHFVSDKTSTTTNSRDCRRTMWTGVYLVHNQMCTTQCFGLQKYQLYSIIGECGR